MRRSIDDFKHHLPARNVGKTPVYCRRSRVNRHHMNSGYGRFHVVDCGTLTQNQRHKLQVGYAGRFLLLIIFLIFAISREIKQPGRKPCLVQSLGHKFLLFYRQPDISITSRKLHAVGHAARHERLLLISPRHHHIYTVEVATTPLNGTSHNGATVAAFQSNSRASHPRQTSRRAGYDKQQYLFHNPSIYFVIHKYSILQDTGKAISRVSH